jgi:hypothetical protein
MAASPSHDFYSAAMTHAHILESMVSWVEDELKGHVEITKADLAQGMCSSNDYF